MRTTRAIVYLIQDPGKGFSFDAIAHKADFTPEKVAFFLLDPHPKMPNFPLSRNEAADLAAYIGSLRR